MEDCEELLDEASMSQIADWFFEAVLRGNRMTIDEEDACLTFFVNENGQFVCLKKDGTQTTGDEAILSFFDRKNISKLSKRERPELDNIPDSLKPLFERGAYLNLEIFTKIYDAFSKNKNTNYEQATNDALEQVRKEISGSNDFFLNLRDLTNNN